LIKKSFFLKTFFHKLKLATKFSFSTYQERKYPKAYRILFGVIVYFSIDIHFCAILKGWNEFESGRRSRNVESDLGVFVFEGAKDIIFGKRKVFLIAEIGDFPFDPKRIRERA
jgi:hypothetical protein